MRSLAEELGRVPPEFLRTVQHLCLRAPIHRRLDARCLHNDLYEASRRANGLTSHWTTCELTGLVNEAVIQGIVSVACSLDARAFS